MVMSKLNDAQHGANEDRWHEISTIVNILQIVWLDFEQTEMTFRIFIRILISHPHK